MEVEINEMIEYVYHELIHEGFHVSEEDILLILDLQLEFLYEKGVLKFDE